MERNGVIELRYWILGDTGRYDCSDDRGSDERLTGGLLVSRDGLSDGGILEIPGRGPGSFAPGPDQSGKYFFARTRSGLKKIRRDRS